MAISEKKMQMVMNNYFKAECTVNTSIREAFEKGFRIGVTKEYDRKWIPCVERLPEDFQKVLVFWWEHSEPMIDTAFWQKDAKRFDGQHWVRMEDKVTHWMPLPKPPAFNEAEE